MKSYIVRIYRHEEDAPRSLIGVLETTEVKEKMAFQNVDELVNMLIKHTPVERRKTERSKLKLPIVVKGTNTLRESFSEDTNLTNLSTEGACFFLDNPVKSDDRLEFGIDHHSSGLNAGALKIWEIHLVSDIIQVCSSLNVVARVERFKKRSDRKGVGVSFDRRLSAAADNCEHKECSFKGFCLSGKGADS